MSIAPTLARVSLFFKKEELLNQFEVKMETEYYGVMKISSSKDIVFGISPMEYITCIIADLNDLPIDILKIFLRNLVSPDRVGKHYQMYLDGDAWNIRDNTPN